MDILIHIQHKKKKLSLSNNKTESINYGGENIKDNSNT